MKQLIQLLYDPVAFENIFKMAFLFCNIFTFNLNRCLDVQMYAVSFLICQILLQNLINLFKVVIIGRNWIKVHSTLGGLPTGNKN